MWTDMATVLRAVYPALLLLRLADRKTPGMDKLFYYCRQMEKTLDKSETLLDEMQKKYKDDDGKFDYYKMTTYFLQSNDMTDILNEDSTIEFNENDSDSDDDEDEEDAVAGTKVDDDDEVDSDGENISNVVADVSLGKRMRSRWDIRKKN